MAGEGRDAFVVHDDVAGPGTDRLRIDADGAQAVLANEKAVARPALEVPGRGWRGIHQHSFSAFIRANAHRRSVANKSFLLRGSSHY